MAEEAVDDPAMAGSELKSAAKKQRRGILGRIWRGIFGRRSDDYEKRLQYLSKEEASIQTRMKRRALSSRRMARNIIFLSVIVEVIAVAYAIMISRSLELNWQMRAVRILPMFMLPAVSSAIYSSLLGLTRMLDRKDQKTLESLRAERKEKIDELKERTNYYKTQQLIQRYDLDPAAKAAAAAVLASKMGEESGLSVHLGDGPKTDPLLAKSNDAELAGSAKLRNRRQPHSRSKSAGDDAILSQAIIDEGSGIDGQSSPAAQSRNVVEHYSGPGRSDGGWIARIAALLVGEDPSQSYALICGNCYMHNGLARKEDFRYITYYCPHCLALNRPHQSGDQESGSLAVGDGSCASDGAEITRNVANVEAPSVGDKL